MTYHRVDAPACMAIFQATDGCNILAAAVHAKISTEVDVLGQACTGESATLMTSLEAVYNRVLTRNMTGATQQVGNATAGGRSAVAAILNGDYEMAARMEQEAHIVDEVKITDGKDLS